MNSRSRVHATLVLVGSLAMFLLMSQLSASPITLTGFTAEARANDVGISVLATPTPTATVGPSVLTVTPTPTVPAVTPTATPVVTSTGVINVPSFSINISLSSGGSTVSLERAIELHDLEIREDQPLPSGTLPLAPNPQFSADMTLAVTTFEPLRLALQRFHIDVTGTAISADVQDIGTVDIAVPGTTTFEKSVTQQVEGIGEVTFTFQGDAETALP